MALFSHLLRKECPTCHKMMPRADLQRHVKRHSAGTAQYRSLLIPTPTSFQGISANVYEGGFGYTKVLFRKAKGTWSLVKTAESDALLARFSEQASRQIEAFRVELNVNNGCAPAIFTTRPVPDAA